MSFLAWAFGLSAIGDWLPAGFPFDSPDATWTSGIQFADVPEGLPTPLNASQST